MRVGGHRKFVRSKNREKPAVACLAAALAVAAAVGISAWTHWLQVPGVEYADLSVH